VIDKIQTQHNYILIYICMCGSNHIPYLAVFDRTNMVITNYRTSYEMRATDYIP